MLWGRRYIKVDNKLTESTDDQVSYVNDGPTKIHVSTETTNYLMIEIEITSLCIQTSSFKLSKKRVVFTELKLEQKDKPRGPNQFLTYNGLTETKICF